MSYYFSVIFFLVFYSIIKILVVLIHKLGLDGINLYTLKPFNYEIIDDYDINNNNLNN